MSPQEKERIERDAGQAAIKNASLMSDRKRKIYTDAYIAGATAEAEDKKAHAIAFGIWMYSEGWYRPNEQNYYVKGKGWPLPCFTEDELYDLFLEHLNAPKHTEP